MTFAKYEIYRNEDLCSVRHLNKNTAFQSVYQNILLTIFIVRCGFHKRFTSEFFSFLYIGKRKISTASQMMRIYPFLLRCLFSPLGDPPCPSHGLRRKICNLPATLSNRSYRTLQIQSSARLHPFL